MGNKIPPIVMAGSKPGDVVTVNAAAGQTTVVVAPAEPPKPWYTSRGAWGSIMAMASGFGMLFHVQFDAATSNELLEIGVGGGALVGGIIALYGRIRAVAPLVWSTLKGAHLMPLLATMLVVSSLGACSTLSALSPTTDQKARAAVAVTFNLYRVSWQPILLSYSALPYCDLPGVHAPCRDRALYRKLYDADGAVVACAAAAVTSLLSDEPDYSRIAPCLDAVEQAKLAIANSGIAKSVPVAGGST